MPPFKVETFDTRIRRVLLRRILNRSLAAGANLNEVRLAKELGVSRTPLRHALIRLEEEGFLVQEPNRGFFVAPLTSEEAAELYPVLAALESLALRSSPPDAKQLRELRRLNAALNRLDPTSPEDAVRANWRWHEALLAGCGNERLMGMIAVLRDQVYRYEIAFFSPGVRRIRTSISLHRSVIDALQQGDAGLACDRLRDHWHTDLDSLAPFERQRPSRHARHERTA